MQRRKRARRFWCVAAIKFEEELSIAKEAPRVHEEISLGAVIIFDIGDNIPHASLYYMQIVNEIIYFVFPLLFAGLIHHFVIIRYNLFSFLSKPIDCNRYFKNQPLFGESKTWRGLLVVPLSSGIGSWIISGMVKIPIILHPVLVGFLLGVGYAIAELPNSFIKRRLNIRAGEKTYDASRFFFLIFDQTDSVIGAMVVMLFIYPASFILCASILIIGSSLHFLVDLYLYRYGYKKLRKN